jgi:hypothetical protein
MDRQRAEPQVILRVWRAVRRALLIGAIGLAIGGCGKHDYVTVVRPNHPVHSRLCARGHLFGNPPCYTNFDARRLLGLKLAAAERLARKYGLHTEVWSRDGYVGLHIADLEYGRIDVNTEHGVVASIHGFG